MKYIFSVFFLFQLSSIQSQSDIDNRFTNLELAQDYAKANNKQVIMVFGGSDWCRPCIKLKKEVLDNDHFIEESKNKFAILYLDFPAKKKNKLSKEETRQNEGLAEKYNQSGQFPKIILFDKNFEKQDVISYKGEEATAFLNLFK